MNNFICKLRSESQVPLFELRQDAADLKNMSKEWLIEQLQNTYKRNVELEIASINMLNSLGLTTQEKAEEELENLVLRKSMSPPKK